MASNLIVPNLVGCDYCKLVLHQNKSTFDIGPVTQEFTVRLPLVTPIAGNARPWRLTRNDNNKMQSSNKQFSRITVTSYV